MIWDFFVLKILEIIIFLAESYNRVPCLIFQNGAEKQWLSWNAFHCNINLFYVLFLFQGSSKANVHMEWDKIWALNKKVWREKNRIQFLKILFLTHFLHQIFFVERRWIFRLSEGCVSFVVCFDSNEVRSYFSSLLGHWSHSTKIHSSLKERCSACVYPWGRRGDEIMPVAS